MRINPDGKEWKSCSAPPRKEAARRGSRTPARAAFHVSGQLRPSSLARRSRTRPSVTSCRTFHTCTDPPFSSTSSLALTSRCHPPAPAVSGKMLPSEKYEDTSRPAQGFLALQTATAWVGWISPHKADGRRPQIQPRGPVRRGVSRRPGCGWQGFSGLLVLCRSW